MHYAQPTGKIAALDDAGIESSENKTSRSAKLSADLGFPIPDEFLSDIIPLTDPKLQYATYHAQRDRRLRLLIRRYTNQIQYGCRNINCATATCLSYRKRNSTVPLRRYTDVSARTLACQLVDDFTRAGSDGRAGLCQNDPIVPWYKDPMMSKKRRNSIEKLSQQKNTVHENGHASKPVGSHTSQRVKEVRRHSPLAEHPPRKPSHDRVVPIGRRGAHRSPGASTVSIQPSGSVIVAIDTSHRQQNERDGSPESRSDLVSAAQPKNLPPPTGTDGASFSQVLFDMLPLRLLGWLPPLRRPPSLEPSLAPPEQQELPDSEHKTRLRLVSHDDVQVADSDQELAHSGIDQQSSGSPHCTGQPPVYTLRALNFNHLSWLQSYKHRPDSQMTYNGQVIAFLKQSLFYCLSDPERLVTAVRDLQLSYGYPALSGESENMDSSNENDSQHKRISSTQTSSQPRPKRGTPSPWPQFRTTTRLEIESLIMSLAFLDHFKQRDLVLNSIFTALQHSYTLPPWLQNHKRLHSPGHLNSGDRLTKTSKGPETDRVKSSESQDVLRNVLSGDGINSVGPLKDSQVCELCLVGLMSIASLIINGAQSKYWGHKFTFTQLRILRNKGRAHSHWPKIETEGPDGYYRDGLRYAGFMIRSIDICDDWNVLRLLGGIMDVISHRLMVAKWSESLKSSNGTKDKKKTIVDLLVARLDRVALTDDESNDRETLSWMGTAIVELVRTIMLRVWNHKPIVQRAGSVGGALELLAAIYRARVVLNLDHQMFTMPFIADIFDDIAMPNEWLSFRPDTRQMHLLSFSFLFEPATLVKYFRAINIESMRKSYEEATIVQNDTRHFMCAPIIPLYGGKEVLAHLRPHMAKYLVLTIRRDDMLNDAINQLWHRERQELLRPLRVRLGQSEGEDGLDHGGVQQEFFRVIFAKALDNDFGMFTTDDTTRNTWFQPGSLEPLYRFEALGILMSIAIYNGITLPVTFPLAFYRKLLNLKVKSLDHIADGWPELTRGLRTLLDWTDGDVGDVIARTYEFSYELYGSTVSVDISRIGRDDAWPQHQNDVGPSASKKRPKSTSFELPSDSAEIAPRAQPSPPLEPSTLPSQMQTPSRTSTNLNGITTPLSLSDSEYAGPNEELEAPLVTNDNRNQYVLDYIHWLVHKSISPQFSAFANGFYTCLDRTALSIFTPEALKLVIEGHSRIDINELERTATYDDFEKDSEYIGWFWQIVRNMSPEQHKHLLEFVTASDRIPVNGMASVVFVIQRNGDGDIDGRLPSSSTCYGRLLLPVYKEREVLEEKLSKAIENCFGFGTL